VETEREVNAAIRELSKGRIFELQQDKVDARLEAAPTPA